MKKKKFAAHFHRAEACRTQGRLDEAMAGYRAALALRPDWLAAQSGLLNLMASSGGGSTPDYLAQAQKYGKLLNNHVNGRAFTAWQPPAEGADLHIGIVSGELRAHPIAYFLEGVLGYLPGLGVKVTLYSTSSEQDAMSVRLRSLCFGGHNLHGLDDAAAAQRIYDDGMDVLIDLSGHSPDNRLPVFGWNPAPLQVSWLGYGATTGVRQMDAVLADAIGVPPAGEAAFVEQVSYLPDARMCFSPPAEGPLPAALPAAAKGSVTFGSFQGYAKVSDAQLTLWARVLAAVPGSVLRWQCLQFTDAALVDEAAERLARCGIGRERAQLLGPVARIDYLAAYAEVDIVLDTSPYPGDATTCEALWMGVPTVTLAGQSMLSRQGASLLTVAGLTDWVADSEEAYVAKAVAAAQDLAALASLRAGLRERVAGSPLCKGYRFAVNLKQALLAGHNPD
jgi:protein O-GlcNAc transferase